jgi:ketosteroid isomerase-like protein
MTETMTDTHAATVQAIYEAFGRGDVPAILERLAPDVVWDRWEHGNGAQQAGVPWMAERHGREDVAGFFAALGALDFHGFEIVALLTGGDSVAAVVELDVTVRATGRRLRDREVHVWRFGPDGLVTEFRHHVDTAKHAAASAG